MFIALGRLPDHPTAIPRVAQLAGLAPSDAARLLAGTFPRVLLRTAADPDAKAVCAAIVSVDAVASKASVVRLFFMRDFPGWAIWNIPLPAHKDDSY